MPVMSNGSQVFVSGALMPLILGGLALCNALPGIEKDDRRFFNGFYSILLLYLGVSIIDQAVYMMPEYAWIETIGIFFEYFLMTSLLPVWTVYMQYSCGENWKDSMLTRLVIGLWLFYLVLLIFTQFTSCFYYLSPDAQYYRTPLHPLLLAPVLLNLLINLLALIRRRRKLSQKKYIAFFIYLFPMTITMFIHMFVYVLSLISICLSVSLFVMYIIMLTDQIEQYVHQQEKIAQQNASIMVLKMRPHFIYNTMTTIYYLCEQDAKQAQQVTLDFTTYLRRNFNAIASEKTIPFSEELEHTRAYFAVEKAQFEDSLFIDCDTEYTQFFLPPLTLQPLVENAIKHGMNPDSQPLYINIRTRERDLGSEIIVEDNGSGFDPADVCGPDTTLGNIKQRLKMMCSGDMIISSHKGIGTVIKIRIPKV